jgi:hypothetical protein
MALPDSRMWKSAMMNIDESVSRVIRAAGGQLVRDLLPTGQNLVENADYFFPQYAVIVELKRIEKDLNDDVVFREKRNALYHKWVVTGRVAPMWSTVQVELRSLPQDCALELVTLYRERIRRRISKANKQIRSTKQLLGVGNAVGLLVLVHNGDYSVGPESVINLTSRCMNGDLYSNIDNVLYLSDNMLADRPGERVGYQFFIPLFRNPSRRLPEELRSKLNSNWYQELNGQSTTRIITVEQPDPGYLDSFRYRKPRIPRG